MSKRTPAERVISKINKVGGIVWDGWSDNLHLNGEVIALTPAEADVIKRIIGEDFKANGGES